MGAFDHLEWTYDGAFEQLFSFGRGEFEQNFPKIQMPGGLPGGDVEASTWLVQYYKDLDGINKVLLLLNEDGDPSFLFQNLSCYNTNN